MTTITTETARLETDFNGVRDGETLVARFDFSGSARLPVPGEQVELYDGEGNRCLGVVVEQVEDDHFRIKPTWDTWTDAEDNQTPAAHTVDLMEALRASVRRAGDKKTAPVEKFTEVA